MKIAKRKKRAEEGGEGDDDQAPKPSVTAAAWIWIEDWRLTSAVIALLGPQEEEKVVEQEEGSARGGAGGGDSTRSRDPSVLAARSVSVFGGIDSLSPPHAGRRKELASRLSAIVKKPAGTKGRKKKQQDEEDLEMLNDEAVASLRKDMLRAAEEDFEQNNLGRPAVYKLKMLPRVVELMQKTALAETIVEGGLLEAVRAWLEPLPDRSLPALNIQRPLFNLLRTLSIELSALKSSGLGKVVYFYTKCKRVDPQIKRVADQLVADWMRPILRRSGAFIDREGGAAGGYGSASHAAAVAAARKMQQGAAGGGAGATRHARIPEAITATFQHAPGSAVTGQMASLPGSGTGTKMRSFKAKLQASSQAARRV